MKIWIIGHRAIIATNGHEYIAEPFVAFRTIYEAETAAHTVNRLTGEMPIIIEVPLVAEGRAPAEAFKS